MPPTLDTTALYDIEGPLALRASFPWMLALGGLLGLILGVILYKLYSKRKCIPPHKPQAHPYDEALAKLSQVSLGANAASFAAALSDILRTFIHYKLNHPILYQTTEEFIASLGPAASHTLLHQDILAFLQYCDLIKFAKAHLSQEERAALLGKLRKLLDNLHHTPTPQKP